ncbi:hypothetical protein AB0B56_34935 [Streptosporangium canum]|uniref:hypothetical protein n=1 Tax=Streptosporangium canum TaxID=324952 RepID=UPI00342F33A4
MCRRTNGDKDARCHRAASVNDDLTLDFDDRHRPQPGHYAFLIDDDTFDAVIARARSATTSSMPPCSRPKTIVRRQP